MRNSRTSRETPHTLVQVPRMQLGMQMSLVQGVKAFAMR